MESSQHKYFLRQRHTVSCSMDALERDEIALLERYGNWLEALADGTLQPITEEQRAFVAVHQGKRDASSHFEVVWCKYRCRQILELAKRVEGQISESGVTYEQLHRLYRQAAHFGDIEAVAWLGKEGFSPFLNWTVDQFTLALPVISPQIIAGISGNVRGKVVSPTLSGDEVDWGNSLDDDDAADWEQRLGGPDE